MFQTLRHEQVAVSQIVVRLAVGDYLALVQNSADAAAEQFSHGRLQRAAGMMPERAEETFRIELVQPVNPLRRPRDGVEAKAGRVGAGEGAQQREGFRPLVRVDRGFMNASDQQVGVHDFLQTLFMPNSQPYHIRAIAGPNVPAGSSTTSHPNG